MSTASQILAGTMYSAAQDADYKSKTKLCNVQVLLSSCQKESGRVKWMMPWVGKNETMQGHTYLKQLCSSVRATLMNILKWASCRLYKKFRVVGSEIDGSDCDQV